MTKKYTLYVDDLLIGAHHVRNTVYSALPYEPRRLDRVIDFEILNLEYHADRRVLRAMHANGTGVWMSLGPHFSVRAVPEAPDG